VNKETADFGCKLLARYAVLGQWNFVTIIGGCRQLECARSPAPMGRAHRRCTAQFAHFAGEMLET
jgi:hypothetical protein